MIKTLDEWSTRFRTADPRYGPVPLWWWDGEEITRERIRWQMEKLRAGGLRNLCIINLAPTGPNVGSAASQPAFYSEAWWDLFAFAVQEAERLAMFLWYYDQIGFSGANFPAQLVTQHPQFAGYHLGRWQIANLPAGADLVATDPRGFVYATVRHGYNWLDAQACAGLLDRIHGEMERRMGPYLGTIIRGSFQDELPPLPTWSPEIPTRYRARYDEALESRLSDLFNPDPAGALVRRRVWGLLGELAEAAFFRPLGEWHQHHHLLIGCDQAGPGRAVDPHGAQRLYLDYARTHRWFSAPGNDPDGEIKAQASIAHVWGGERVWLEAFHSSGWGGTLEDTLEWLLPWFQAGATLYNPHAIYYTTRGGWWEWAAPDTGWRQPYWEHYSIFADLIARLSWALGQGRHVADIAVYYPAHAIWESMTWAADPERQHPMQVARQDPAARVAHIRHWFWQLVGRQDRNDPLLGALRGMHRDFDELDDTALQMSEMDPVGLRVRHETYRVVILPGTEKVDPATLAKLSAFVASGGLVIGLAVPEDERSVDGAIAVDSLAALSAVLDAHLPKRVEGPGLSLERQLEDGSRVILLLPPLDRMAPMHEPAGAKPLMNIADPDWCWIAGDGIPEAWDPTTGRPVPLAVERDGRGFRFRADFDAWPAMLVVVRAHGHPALDAAREFSVAAPVPAHIGADRSVPDRTIAVPKDGWTIRIHPTFDNTYGDFDRHRPGSDAPVEVRRVQVRVEAAPNEGVVQQWQHASLHSDRWLSRLWSECAYWTVEGTSDADDPRPTALVYSEIFGDIQYRTWAGRMGRVPRTFLNFGHVPVEATRVARTHVFVATADRYWLTCEGTAPKRVLIDGAEYLAATASYAATTPVQLGVGWHTLVLEVRAVGTESLRIGLTLSAIAPDLVPAWIRPSTMAVSRRRLAKTIQVNGPIADARVHLVVMHGSCQLSIDDQPVVTLGDFMPYSRWGQQAVDLAPWLVPGEHQLRLTFDDQVETMALLDGMWHEGPTSSQVIVTDESWQDSDGISAAPVLQATDDHWVVARRHPLSGVAWLGDDSLPGEGLPFVLDPARMGQAVWLRFMLPTGATVVQLALAGTLTHAWIDGTVLTGTNPDAIPIPPGMGGRWLIVRIQPNPMVTEAAVLTAPIGVMTEPAIGVIGPWAEALSMPTYSGAVEYERIVEGGEGHAVLDLGQVRGTAEVWVDDWNAGVRLWQPFRFDCSPGWGPGPHRLRIRVTNTLGAHYGDGKPTDLCPPEQTVSGLIGPITWHLFPTASTEKQ